MYKQNQMISTIIVPFQTQLGYMTIWLKARAKVHHRVSHLKMVRVTLKEVFYKYISHMSVHMLIASMMSLVNLKTNLYTPLWVPWGAKDLDVINLCEKLHVHHNNLIQISLENNIRSRTLRDPLGLIIGGRLTMMCASKPLAHVHDFSNICWLIHLYDKFS